MTRNSKRKLQEEEESQIELKCTKSVRMDPEISPQLAKIDEPIKTESQEVKRGN